MRVSVYVLCYTHTIESIQAIVISATDAHTVGTYIWRAKRKMLL